MVSPMKWCSAPLHLSPLTVVAKSSMAARAARKLVGRLSIPVGLNHKVGQTGFPSKLRQDCYRGSPGVRDGLPVRLLDGHADCVAPYALVLDPFFRRRGEPELCPLTSLVDPSIECLVLARLQVPVECGGGAWFEAGAGDRGGRDAARACPLTRRDALGTTAVLHLRLAAGRRYPRPYALPARLPPSAVCARTFCWP